MLVMQGMARRHFVKYIAIVDKVFCLFGIHTTFYWYWRYRLIYDYVTRSIHRAKATPSMEYSPVGWAWTQRMLIRWRSRETIFLPSPVGLKSSSLRGPPGQLRGWWCSTNNAKVSAQEPEWSANQGYASRTIRWQFVVEIYERKTVHTKYKNSNNYHSNKIFKDNYLSVEACISPATSIRIPLIEEVYDAQK